MSLDAPPGMSRGTSLPGQLAHVVKISRIAYLSLPLHCGAAVISSIFLFSFSPSGIVRLSMFTGIVKGLGTVTNVVRRDEFLDMTIDVGDLLATPEIGASVAIDGVCLTVVALEGSNWTFSVMQETLDKTTIGDRKIGDRVCLEQPLKMGEELGGHMVLGHVDGTGEIVAKKVDGENCWVTLRASEFFVKYIVPKGSIAIDGVSLTVCDPRVPPPYEGGAGGGPSIEFSVSLLPLTLERTTLGFKDVGDRVNLEADYILKAMVR